MLTKIIRLFKRTLAGNSTEHIPNKPVIISRANHPISRANISNHALKVLYRLRDAGFEAYLVGGGVRDVLLKLHPKDFDIATNAKPEQIQQLFRNCRLIGRRFRLAHIHFGNHIVEVATFRANLPEHKTRDPNLMHSQEGMILRDNLYGTLVEDVWRRDFTVNALYYNIADFSLIDYVGGLQDLKDRRLRMIGDPSQRYREDPVRMLRAIRFAGKLDFSIHPETEAPLFELAYLIKQVPAARVLDEYIKLFLSGSGEASFRLLRHYGFFALLFPETESCLHSDAGDAVENFIKNALLDTDKRVHEQKTVALPFLLAAFLWFPVCKQEKILVSEGLPPISAFYEACHLVLNHQQKNSAISRRFAQSIREIWGIQMRLSKGIGKRAAHVMVHPRFRAAYDFLLLRAKVEETHIKELASEWQKYVEADDETRISMVDASKATGPSSRRYRRKRVKRV